MVTIKDVAKAAGVSISTVSLVVNNVNQVKPSTREKVLKVIEELNYKPDASARSLVTKRTKVVAVIRCVDGLLQESNTFTSTVDTYLSEMLNSMESTLSAAGYSLMVEWAQTNLPGQLPQLFTSHRMDGVLLVGGIVRRDLLEACLTMQVPVVLVGSRHDKLDYVDTDIEPGLTAVVRTLVGQGHRRIALMNGPDYSQTSPRKLAGYRQGLMECGLPMDYSLVVNGMFTGEGGYCAMKALLALEERPTAVIAAADSMAVGAMRYLHQAKVRCPEDVSLVGYEDGILAEYAVPPLSTLCIHKDQLGKLAGETLLWRLENPKAAPRHLLVKPELVKRESVCAK